MYPVKNKNVMISACYWNRILTATETESVIRITVVEGHPKSTTLDSQNMANSESKETFAKIRDPSRTPL